MFDQRMLRAKALDAIRRGRLSRRRPERLWGCSGDGSICPVCESAIEPDAIGMELEGGIPGQTCSVHSHCFAAWDAVRQHEGHGVAGDSGRFAGIAEAARGGSV
jgi:hypothetical protein